MWGGGVGHRQPRPKGATDHDHHEAGRHHRGPSSSVVGSSPLRPGQPPPPNPPPTHSQVNYGLVAAKTMVTTTLGAGAGGVGCLFVGALMDGKTDGQYGKADAQYVGAKRTPPPPPPPPPPLPHQKPHSIPTPPHPLNPPIGPRTFSPAEWPAIYSLRCPRPITPYGPSLPGTSSSSATSRMVCWVASWQSLRLAR